MAHEFPAIPFVVHVVGSIHQAYRAHFFRSWGVLFFGDGAVRHWIPFVRCEAVLHWDFPQGGIHGGQSLVVCRAYVVRKVRSSRVRGCAFFGFLPALDVIFCCQIGCSHGVAFDDLRHRHEVQHHFCVFLQMRGWCVLA